GAAEARGAEDRRRDHHHRERERPHERERQDGAEGPDRERSRHGVLRPDAVDDQTAENAADGNRGEDQSPRERPTEVLGGHERAEHEVDPDAEVAEGEAEEAGGEPTVSSHPPPPVAPTPPA